MTNDAQVIPREQRPVIAQLLAQSLAGPVAIETWTQRDTALVRTDRDPCTFCGPVAAAARQLASMHPLLSLTPYDLDRHAGRAAEAGVERPPLTVLRGRNGREVRFTGLWSGLLFPALLDAIVFLGAGVAPIAEETRAALRELDGESREPLELELLAAPYDPYSGHTLRVAGAFAVESRRVRLHAIEISEFPRLAEARMVSQVPVLTLNGRRYTGAWDEDDLLEQLRRSARGDAEPAIRKRVLHSPYLTLEQAQELAARQAQGLAAPGAAPPGAAGEPPAAPGGLVIPGR